MSYKSLGFFSYSRAPGADEWYAKSKQKIQQYMQNSLGVKTPGVFFDRHNLKSGQNFKQKLSDGLDGAPILIAFFSSSYFNSSDYCGKELATFLEREKFLDLEQGSLIHVARVSENVLFPPWAHDIQAENFSDFYNLSQAFWGATEGHQFETELKLFAEGAASKIFDVMEKGLWYRPDFPRMDNVPNPSEVNPNILALLGPQATVRRPFMGGLAP